MRVCIVYNIVYEEYEVCVIQLYFGRGEIHLYCVSWIWHSYPDSSASIYFIAPTKITPGAWRDPASCVGYVVFSPLFSCLSNPGTVQIRQFPLTYQIFNFVTQIKNPHLSQNFPKVGIVEGWRLECWIPAIFSRNSHYMYYVWCVGSLFSPLTMT